jgi:hypothetical protein
MKLKDLFKRAKPDTTYSVSLLDLDSFEMRDGCTYILCYNVHAVALSDVRSAAKRLYDFHKINLVLFGVDGPVNDAVTITRIKELKAQGQGALA